MKSSFKLITIIVCLIIGFIVTLLSQFFDWQNIICGKGGYLPSGFPIMTGCIGGRGLPLAYSRTGIIPFNLIIDILFWSLLAFIIIAIIQKLRKKN